VVWRSRGAAAGLIVGLLVLSHWVLDAITHRPDLPLWPGASPLVGLGLWNAVAASDLGEPAIYTAATERECRRLRRAGDVAAAVLGGVGRQA
jgi:hypothetical protein